jgi:hypothetical protein
MKKLSLFVAALFLAQFSFAQKGVEIGVNFTPTNPWILNDEDFSEGPDQDFRGTFGYNAGLSLGFNLTDAFGITTGLQLSRQGQNYITGYDGVAKADQDLFARQLTYIRIPLLLRYSSPEGGSFFRFGPHLDMLSRARFVYDDKGILNADQDIDMRNFKPFGASEPLKIYKKTAIGVTMEMGGRININENMFVPITLHLSGSFNTEDEDAGRVFPSSRFPNYNRSSAYNVAVGLSIGFHYVLPMGK